MAAALDTLLAELGSRVSHASEIASFLREPAPLVLGSALDDALPDGGLPRGVIELASPRALGGATSVAISAVRAAQKRDLRAWCAWIDPEGSLYAPGLARAGIDLARLLVVRPPRAELGRIAVKVASARALDVLVVDMDACGGPTSFGASRAAPLRSRWSLPAEGSSRPSRRPIEPEVIVRKLALLAEEGGARVLLLTDADQPRRAQWPVAMRLELTRGPESLTVRVAKDKRGRVGVKKTLGWTVGGDGRRLGVGA
jgi:recA bacterial DNA recombination protein